MELSSLLNSLSYYINTNIDIIITIIDTVNLTALLVNTIIIDIKGHPASHVTLLMSGGKFASGANFSGGRFLSFRGALFFLQGGAYFF